MLNRTLTELLPKLENLEPGQYRISRLEHSETFEIYLNIIKGMTVSDALIFNFCSDRRLNHIRVGPLNCCINCIDIDEHVSFRLFAILSTLVNNHKDYLVKREENNVIKVLNDIALMLA